jgi:para-aminobenzoate synthetase component I
MSLKSAVNKINQLGSEKKPFFFIFDFELENPIVFELNNLPRNILIETDLFSNFDKKYNPQDLEYFKITPPKKESFKTAFENIQKNLHHGNTFLLNLTFPSEIKTNLSLDDLFYKSNARFKIKYFDEFVCFSPEIFIEIKGGKKGGKIYSYPMKGTIDAGIPDAENILLSDEKEIAEHYTIVDLIRNDLSIVAENIQVEKFRYIEKIKTNDKILLQTSSKISGDLTFDYHKNLGEIISKLLPAGSVSGAPKARTLEIISENEAGKRGYYSGVFGIYDGENLTSCVMIRYVEKQNDGGMYFRSGGGITAESEMKSEYEELIQKIYVPFI